MNTKRIPILLMLIAATGCGASAVSSAVSPAAIAPPETNASADVSASPQALVNSKQSTTTPVVQSTSAKSADPKKTDAAQSPDFLIMYTGDVLMSVDDAKISSTLDAIIDAAEAAGGHLGARRDAGVTVRVPSPRFRETLAKISALGEIAHESVTAEDVSEEFHDAEVRLANLKATRQRLQDFLAKSASVTDMLTLERELERVSMEIDRIEGRMRFLKEHVAFSTLTITLTPRAKSQPIVVGGKPVANSPRVMQLHAEWLDDMGVPKLVGPST